MSTLPPAPVGNLYRAVLAGGGPGGLVQIAFDGDSLWIERSATVPGEAEGGAPRLLGVVGGDTLLTLAGPTLSATPGTARVGKLDLATGAWISVDDAPELAGALPAGVDAEGRVVLLQGGNVRRLDPRGTAEFTSAATLPDCAERGPAVLDPVGDTGGASDGLLSACASADRIDLLDLTDGEVVSRYSVRPGEEGALGPGIDTGEGAPDCRPDALTVTPDGLYVGCGADGRVVVLDAGDGSFVTEFYLGGAPTSLRVTPDGGLLAVLLGDAGAVEFLDLGNGIGMGSARSTAGETRSAAVSTDGRYLFLTSAADPDAAGPGAGESFGALDIFDLATLRRVTGIEIGAPVGDVLFWTLVGSDDAARR